MATSAVLLPGDRVPEGTLPKQHSKTLTLGPGLRYTPPSTITATVAGTLSIDSRKNAIWLETNGGGRYVPTPGDLVIATVHHSSVDMYHCALSPYTSFATLPQLAFEGASKKTRPMLQPGSLVYARVSMANKHMDPEIECVHPSTGKSDGLGELKGGTVFDVSLGMARRLMMAKMKEEGAIAALEELSERGLRFEIAVGRNGLVWVNSESVKTTLVVRRAIQDIDSHGLTIDEQSKMVKRLLKII